MAIEGLSSILKQREHLYGPIIGDKVDDTNAQQESSIDLSEVKSALETLANNQQSIYNKLDELIKKLETK